MAKRVRKVSKRALIIKPVRPRAVSQEKFQKSLDYVFSRYRKSLKNLA